MADFRRCILALAFVALLATTASAQSLQPFSCNASAAVPPFLRAEGLTELTGDIVLTCTGSGPSGSANFTVFLGNTTVTSRILDTTSLASEALLLIDEPGPAAGTPLATSVPYVTSGAGQNMFQGTIVGNQVTFLGVPVVPPGSVGNRIYRITNIRANASAVGTGASGTPGQVTAFISITGPTSVPVNNAQQTVGFVQKGLDFKVVRANDVTASLNAARRTFSQCADITKDTPRGILRFTELFATAFKASGRLTTTATPTQNIPGQIYNTESGLIPILTGGTTPLIRGGGTTLSPGFTNAGEADFATRLRAVFNNIPTGVNVYVSTSNIINDVPFNTIKTPAATLPSAVLIASETGPRLDVAPIADNFRAKDSSGGKVVTVAQLTVAAGSATAVWEVTGAPNTLASDNWDFYYYFQSSANQSANSPAAGVTGTVNGNFAPAPPAFSATDGAKASATLPIPRFADTSSGTNIITVVVCRTSLLFPFVTNQAGFDTGMAIANTTKDPFKTDPQAGTCSLNFYGDNAPAPITTASLAAGTVYTALAQSVAPNFQGYMIAICQFQYAHGFAFVSDVGARNLAMGYLALVIPDKFDGSRTNPAIALDDSDATGELLGQ